MAANGGRLATVFGGSGFVGRYVVQALAQRGWRVRAAVRRPDLAGHLQPMGTVGQIFAVQANLRYPQSVMAACEGAALVVNAVGILAGIGKQTFQSVHVDGAKTVADSARQAGAAQLVHVSAIGADPKSRAQYARSKAAGEAAVRSVFPGAVILRPSIVFGPEDEFFNRFAAMTKVSPLLPLIGGGTTKFQPVYVGDVAAAVTRVAEGKANPGTIYEVGGPEILTFRALLDRVLDYTDRQRGYLPIPIWAAKLQALLTKPLPNSLRPITLDQVRLLETDNVVSPAARDEGCTLDGLGIKPRAISDVVPTYLERFKPRGQFAHYRSG